MDNYLSHRWPQGALVTQRPEKARQKKKTRRVLRTLAVCLLLAALLVGLMAAGWFLAQKALEQWAADLGRPEQSAPAWPEPTQEETPELSIPRAEVGLGVTLELDETRLSALPAQEIYQQVLPSVVSVVTHMSSGQGYGAGSGVIMREDGYILTNYHVIEGGDAVKIMLLSDGATYDAQLVGYDESLDIAVLKIDAEGLTAAQFGDSDLLEIGDAAYAIGNPMGYLYGTMTDGIISALHVEVDVDGKSMNLIQTSAALNSGNSGGALINEQGQVVGITVAKISGKEDEALVEGLGLAIPISDARPFINYILETGETCQPAIGITCSAAAMDGTAGVMVQSVEPDGPAREAGLQKLDLIVAGNGKAVDSIYSLKRLINETGVGGVISLTVLREGERLEVTCHVVDSVWQ